MTTAPTNEMLALADRCREIREWQKTGLLCDGAIRELAKTMPAADEHQNLHLAESKTAEEAMDAVIRLAATPSARDVREALAFAKDAMSSLRDALKDEPAVRGRAWIGHGIAINNAIERANKALSETAGPSYPGTVTFKIPHGYASAEAFANDCGFEIVSNLDAAAPAAGGGGQRVVPVLVPNANSASGHSVEWQAAVREALEKIANTPPVLLPSQLIETFISVRVIARNALDILDHAAFTGCKTCYNSNTVDEGSGHQRRAVTSADAKSVHGAMPESRKPAAGAVFPSDPPLQAPAHSDAVREVLDWAVARWHAEVRHRPLKNIHRRSLDDTWRQMIRHLGGDDIALCGPKHDDLVNGDAEYKS